MITIIKNNILVVLTAFAVLANFGVLYYQNSKIKNLKQDKENLNKELKAIREQILKGTKQDDEVINEPLRDSVNFIVKRLREQENNK